jgi:nitrite reductase (cytochrome c-552)
MTKRIWLALIMLYVSAVAAGAVSHFTQPERLTASTVAAEVFGRYYPLQYQSYLQNKSLSTNESKLEASPYLSVVYQEHGFAIEFNTTRGHVYSLEDVIATARGKGPACLVCKSPEAHAAVAGATSGATFAAIAAGIKQPITCANCHDPADMSLRVTNAALIAELNATDRAAWLADKDKMQVLVCAQCHIEYYCPPTALTPTIPWGNGLAPEDIEAWQTEAGIVDWVHPLAGTDLLKLQHPEFETYQDGLHANLGVTCAECHMPKVTTDGTRHTSHLWTSPLSHMEASCASCHADLPAIEALARQKQVEVAGKTRATGEALAALATQLATYPDGTAKDQARELYAKAHFRWDWIFCENSTGFHNFALANSMLDEAMSQIAQARALLR